MKAGIPALALAVSLVAMGCTPAERPMVAIKAQRDPGFGGRVSRLLVMIPRSDHADEDSMFRKFVEQALHDKGVAALAVVVTNATDVVATMQSAELAGQRAAIDTLAPQAVLDLKMTVVASHSRRPEWRVHIHYDASLYSIPLEPMARRIWRAQLKHSGPEMGMEGRFQLAAERLVDRLDADGLLARNIGPHH